MSNKMAFLLFGDQSLEIYKFLADLCRRKSSTVLAQTFIERAGDVLRQEVESLGVLARSKIPAFRTLQQLNEKYHSSGTKHAGIENALLCAVQLTHYIEYVRC